MKHCVQQLPAGYGECLRVNLQSDKKTAMGINIAGGAGLVAMMALAHFAFMPLTRWFSRDESIAAMLLKMFVLLGGYFVYIVLHELTHAAVMKLFGGTKLRFGFTGLYAYAGSEYDYFDKPAYIAVALAPLLVWGAVFTVLLVLVPADWFWVVYFWQMGNIGGAAGDLYVTFKFARLPKDILVMDTGLEMTVFAK